ncbi:hypothetical protein [Jannaschia sp. 2305UL9-9]|uniref:hypothetical protein n=1 Tax=Jannaschia sp. 2305UL9-9 TaxID=3121638 RepID=UPI003527D1FE
MSFALEPRDRRVHVFSVSDGALNLAHQTYLSRLSDPVANTVPLAQAFDAAIDPTYAEVFAIGDIAPMRLRDYLAQAHDIRADVLSRDAARLDGLSGDVVVLAPQAVEGVTMLTPRPELTHIGSYAPAEVDNRPRDLPPAAKTSQLADAPEVPAGPGLNRRVIGLIVAVAIVLAAIGLLLI